MNRFYLYRSRIQSDFLKKASIILLIFCCSIQESRAKTLNDVLKSKCSVDYGKYLDIQISSFTSQQYNCRYMFEYVQDYAKDYDQLSEEKKNVYQIYSYFEKNPQNLQLQYSYSDLTQYLLYKKFSEQTSSCGDKNIANRLGSYEKCQYCLGKSICERKNNEFNSQLEKNFSIINLKNNDSEFWTMTRVQVQSFQILWNCNNPNDQLQITGRYDQATESKLLQTGINGFKYVCWNCNLQNCFACLIDYKQCIQCRDGYVLKNKACIQCPLSKCSKCAYDSNIDKTFCNACHQGSYLLEGQCVDKCPDGYQDKQNECVKCPLSNCSKCTYDSDKDQTICNECRQDFYLHQGKCVGECPDGYQVTQNECVKCSPGTVYLDKMCIECSKFCKECTGPHPSQCQQCSDGFNFEEGKGCTFSDFDLILSFKAKAFIDTRTNTLKECNFSCDECVDSSDLCITCNPSLKYFVKEGDRQKCYNRCPLYYEPKLTNLDPQSDFVECVISQSYTADLYAADQIKNEAKSRCPKQQFWNIQTKLCNKCSNNCINCNDGSSCIECEPTYYWNDSRKTCSPCHPSCQKCSGPLQNNCLSCATGNKLFPDKNGICDASQSNPLPQFNILTQNEIYGNLQSCKQFLSSSQQQNYAIEFSQIFSSNNAQWKDIKMMSKEKPCTFQEFKNRYRYLKNSIQTCDENEISQSTIGKNGDLLTIYSMLLSQSGAQISNSGAAVDPQTLAEYAINNSFFSSSYIFSPTVNFNCNQLQCFTQLDSALNGFTSSDTSKGITIKTLKEIVLTSTNQTPLNCFQDNQLVNQNSIYEIEQLVNNSKYTLKTPTKQYFILDLCGKDLQGNSVQRAMLVQKYLGNAFFEVNQFIQTMINKYIKYQKVLNVSKSLTEKLSLYGASTQQNVYLKNCDSQLTNSLSSYIVQKIRVIQVVEQDKNVDKSETMFQEYNEKVGAAKDSAKCSCVETKDYILANENQGNQFIRVITPHNKILTQSIDAFQINHILKMFKKDANVMKANGLYITKIEAEQVFKEYIEETVQNTKKCYGITNSTPLCMVNLLTDLIFSSQQKCNFSNEITALVNKSDFNGLKNFIQKQNWCNIYYERCLKAQQSMKSCI